jgi:hypothetical protein
MTVQYDDKGFVGFPEFIRITEDGAIFRGNVFEGQDRYEDLVASTEGDFDWASFKPVAFM